MTVDNLNNDLQDLENYLKNVKNKNNGCDENDVQIVLNVLQCPVFKNIVTVQNSLKELKKACLKHPSLGNANFAITPDGKLELIDLPHDEGEQSRDELNESGKSTLSEEDEKRFWQYVERAAKGREVVKVNLFKSQNECLGFNVVGLRAEQEVENLGIFVENIAKNGIADREGSLQVGDQILAIDREMLDGDICHKKAIEILQNARGHIELVVAKDKVSRGGKLAQADNNLVTSLPIEKSLNDLNLSSSSINGAGALNESKNEQELNQFFQNEPHLEKFSQIELIELVNEGKGKGLGFGILGGKSTGVVVKTVVPGGVSDKDGRLKSGDHILQINNIPLRGMSSEQVAQVLRTSGRNVKLLVARQKISLDQMQTEQAPTAFSSISTVEANIELTSKDHEQSQAAAEEEEEKEEEELPKLNEEEAGGYQEKNEVSIINQTNEEFDDQEVETIEVTLVKDKGGLGITVAGFCMDRKLNNVCEREDISGIYVKSIAPNSVADLSGKIQVNDQIIDVDGINLLGFTNHQAVEVLRNTEKVVHIKLARYLKGNKYDRLQLAINNVDFNVVKPAIPAKPNQTILHVNAEPSRSQDTVDNDSYFRIENEMTLMNSERAREYWQNVLGDDYEILVAKFSKFEECSGLGISLDGMLLEEEGKEPKLIHYIESILKQGPVGVNGVLRPGDLILQVNSSKIYNLEPKQVVRLLKELPIDICMICARLRNVEKSVINLGAEPLADEQQQQRQNFYESDISAVAAGTGELLTKERLVKAKSDGSLAIVNSSLEILKITRARSLEPLTGLAMWNSEPTEIVLIKGDRGLGFSVLDYTNPLNTNETVCVIRSLVSGGVAQQNGNLMPGDRLLEVNDCNLRNASLDLAVQALKGAPKGPVRLLVAKPLPISEQSGGQLANINYANFSSPLNKNLDIPLLVQEELAEIEQQSESDARQDSDWKSVDIDDFEKADFELKAALEKSYFNRDDSILINRSRSYSPLSMQYEPSNDAIDDLGYTEIPIPSELERLIVLRKKGQSLGVTLELTTEGINGLIVRALSKKGLLHKDGRIRTGDNLLGINNEGLRNVTTSKARAIFKRVALVEGDVPLKYVPESEAICYRRNSSIEKSKSQRSLPCFKQYCRTPSPTQSVFPPTKPNLSAYAKESPHKLQKVAFTNERS